MVRMYRRGAKMDRPNGQNDLKAGSEPEVTPSKRLCDGRVFLGVIGGSDPALALRQQLVRSLMIEHWPMEISKPVPKP